MRATNILMWIPIVALTFIATGCSTTSIYEKAKRLQQDGKYGEAGELWLTDAKAKLEKREFSSYEFNEAAKSFDRDPKRSSDALSARKLAAIRAMKEAEYFESKFDYSSASISYDNAADIYKNPIGSIKDLDEPVNSEHARLLSIKNYGIHLRSGKSKIEDYNVTLLSIKYDNLIKIISSDKKKVDDYTARRDSHLKSIRDYMPTANRLAQENENRKAEEQRREALEEKARREKSNREFAMAIGAATTMLASAQQMKNRSQQSSPTTNYVAPSTSRYEPSPTLSNRAGSAIPTPMPETSTQINVGNASQARGIGSGNSKFQSKDATHCVEIIPKGFKGCNFKRCVHNACGLEKIYVVWSGAGSGGNMGANLAPGQNTSVNSIFDDGSPVRYKACAWDKRANSSPYTDPCRY